MFHKIMIPIALGALTLVACNSGGNGGDIPPNPNPTETPAPIPGNIQPLQITQNIVPSLNKVAGHKIWYMVIKNPNSEDVLMNPWLGTASPLAQFKYDPSNTSPVDPTKFAMEYDNSISGVTQDCLNYITNQINFPAGASCAFKFEAQWDINTSATTNYNFSMLYAFKTNSGNYYIQEKQGCVDQPKYNTYCLNNNQNLQVNVMQISQTANDFGAVSNTFNFNGISAGNLLSSDGSVLWTHSNTTTYSYLINYNPNSNTYTQVLNNTYLRDLDYVGSTLSINGSNYYAVYYNQNGIMSNVQSTDASLKWVTGLDGNVYGSAGKTGNIYLLDQTNNTISSIISAPGELLAGVSANGNFLTIDLNQGTIYCRLNSNGYNKTAFNMNGFTNIFDYYSYSSYSMPRLSNNYYSIFLQSNKYFALDGTSLLNPFSQSIPRPDLLYKIDIDNCQIVSDNYLTFNFLLNTSYGITGPDSNDNIYIESINSFSNGTDGN